jgi:hypothetical protein
MDLCSGPRFLCAPDRDAVLTPDEYDAFIRETVVVNRTIVEERERIAINPGIEPEFVAAAVGRPLVPVEVRPPVPQALSAWRWRRDSRDGAAPRKSRSPKSGRRPFSPRQTFRRPPHCAPARRAALAGRYARWRPLPSFYLLGMGFRWPCPHLLRIQVTICQRGWTGTVQPAREVTDTDLGI